MHEEFLNGYLKGDAFTHGMVRSVCGGQTVAGCSVSVYCVVCTALFS